MVFSPFLSQLHLPLASQLQLPSPLCDDLPLVTNLVLPPFFPCQLNSTPWMHHPLTSASCPGQGSQLQAFPKCHARLGGSEREQSLGIPHRWQGISTWQCGCRTPFCPFPFFPLCPPTGCSFTAARVQLSEGWLPPAAGKNSKAWSQAAGAFLHFGKYSRIL